MRDKARAFLDDQLPKHLRAHVPEALEAAYNSVLILKKDSELLQLPSTELGHVRAWAVDLAVKRLIDRGKWPFDYDWQPYKNDTGSWLRIRLPHSILSVSQIAEPWLLPREADFRMNGLLNNEPFLKLAEFEDEEHAKGLPHILLTHGYQDLEFAQLGIGSPKTRRYIYRTPNLMKGPRVIETEGPPPEAEDVEAVIELKEAIVRWIRDSEEK